MGESYQDFEADFPKKVSLKMLNWEDYNSIYNLFSVYLKANDYFKLNLILVLGIL